jgi:hypothetical protein
MCIFVRVRICPCAELSVRAFVACAFMTVRFCLCGIVVCAFVMESYLYLSIYLCVYVFIDRLYHFPHCCLSIYSVFKHTLLFVTSSAGPFRSMNSESTAVWNSTRLVHPVYSSRLYVSSHVVIASKISIKGHRAYIKCIVKEFNRVIDCWFRYSTAQILTWRASSHTHITDDPTVPCHYIFQFSPWKRNVGTDGTSLLRFAFVSRQ